MQNLLYDYCIISYIYIYCILLVQDYSDCMAEGMRVKVAAKQQQQRKDSNGGK